MRSSAAFFLLTYIVSWSLFAASFMLARSGASSSAVAGVSQAVLLLGVIAPSMVALALTARAHGRDGVRALIGRIGQVPAARWLVFALGYVVAVKLTAALLHRVVTGEWPRFAIDSAILVPFAILLSTPVQAGEEIGWRGYALPRLAARTGLPSAAAAQSSPFHFTASPIGWLTAIVLWIAAAYFLWRLRVLSTDTAPGESAGDAPGDPRR